MQSAEFRSTNTPKSDVNALLQDAALEDDVPF
jgi:hypothetical protein